MAQVDIFEDTTNYAEQAEQLPHPHPPCPKTELQSPFEYAFHC